jgi:hypothetical protein
VTASPCRHFPQIGLDVVSVERLEILSSTFSLSVAPEQPEKTGKGTQGTTAVFSTYRRKGPSSFFDLPSQTILITIIDIGVRERVQAGTFPKMAGHGQYPGGWGIVYQSVRFREDEGSRRNAG